MALRSLAGKIIPVAAATPRLAPPSRSLHHVEDKLLRRVGGCSYHIGKNAGTDAELVKRVSESRNIDRNIKMTLMIGAASIYGFFLFRALSIRNNARKELRLLEEKYGY
uniref:Uncharacterized protein n=1 Tax=Leersia perrieri TaxID=77586 RepID=A0A0D9WVA7_9ORYZ